MADKFSPIGFRPSAASVAAIQKIMAANADTFFKFTQTHAIEKALTEYAKTLPDVPKEPAPVKSD
jgi:hypothetical protein